MDRSDEVTRLLTALSGALAARDHATELVILDGASLIARNLSARATGDIDVLGIRLPDGVVRTAFPFPAVVRQAADDVAAALGLDPMWLDDRPGSDFVNAAPAGYEQRLERVDYGALIVWHLSRIDITAIKIVARAERWGEPGNKHWEDVVALAPGPEAWSMARAFAERVWAVESAAWVALDQIRVELDA